MPTRRIWLSVIVRIVVCVVLLGVASLFFLRMVLTAPKPVVADRGDARTRVLVFESRATPVQQQWCGFGTAAPVHSADVPSRVTAVVVERPEIIRVGRSVNKGDLLLQLDESDFERQIDNASQAIEDLHAQLKRIDVEHIAWTNRARVAEEELELARLDFDRAKQAMENDAAKQREVDQKRQAMLTVERAAIAAREELDKVPPRKASLQAQLAREQSTLAQSRENAARCRIVAPIDGVIASVDVEVGENVAAGQRVARIVNLERIEVRLLLPSSARPFVAIGDDVALQSDSGNPPLQWLAQVSRISPDDDESSRTMRIYAEVLQAPTQSGVLVPGMFVQGLVTSGEIEARTIVPRRAINSQRIMLVENDRIRSLPVEVEYQLQRRLDGSGLEDVQWAVLRKPLPDGALVVVDGARALSEGSPAEALLTTGESRLTTDASSPTDRTKGTDHSTNGAGSARGGG